MTSKKWLIKFDIVIKNFLSLEALFLYIISIMMFFQLLFWSISIEFVIFEIKIVFILSLIIVNDVDDEWNKNFEKKVKSCENEFESEYWLNEITNNDVEKAKLAKLNIVNAFHCDFDAFYSIKLFMKCLKIKFASFICFSLIVLFSLRLSLNIIFLNMFLTMHSCFS